MNKIVALLFAVALAATARAQTPAQFAALQAQVQSLQAQVAALQRSPVQALVPFLTVDPNPKYGVRGPNIVFHDANVHITNGTFNTKISNGLGNLILGYCEPPQIIRDGERMGSHNLILGTQHKWTAQAIGGIVGGEHNYIGAPGASVLGGTWNASVADDGVVIAGYQNGNRDGEGVIIGGTFNSSSGQDDVIIGGTYTTLKNSSETVVLGGQGNGTIDGTRDQIFPQVVAK